MLTIKAFANSDHAYVVWRADRRIDGCCGFALYRQRGGNTEPVQSFARLQGSTPPATGSWTPVGSDVAPIQSFAWADFGVALGDVARYRVVPCFADATVVHPDDAQGSEWSAPVTVSLDAGAPFSLAFNRGLVAAQWLARALAGQGWSPPVNTPSTGADNPPPLPNALVQALHTAGSDVRAELGGQLRQTLLDLLAEANVTQGPVYVAMFSLTDTAEILPALLALGDRLHIVLANGTQGNDPTKPDENAYARGVLKQATPRPQVVDRLVHGRISHDKFMVLCDAAGTPRKVWTGSANWTPGALCTQANNTLVIDNPAIAATYKAQWDLLAQAGSGFPPALYAADDVSKHVALGTQQVTIWFSPLDRKEPSPLDPSKQMPADLAEASRLIDAAQDILFLMYTPGTRGEGTLYDVIEARLQESAPPFVQGVINIWPGVGHQPGPDPNLPLWEQGTYDLRPAVIVPWGVDPVAGEWAPETMDKVTVHSKVVVLDPFGAHPVVITGSHNFGPTASTMNDENLLIVENNPALATAYAIEIVGIYEHYRARYLQHLEDSLPPGNGSLPVISHALSGGLVADDTWQDAYLSAGARRRALDVWLGPSVAVPSGS